MYDTKYECRYQKDDLFLDTDNVNDAEKEYIRDILYKEDLLNIFNMDENDNYDTIISTLYQQLEKCDSLKELMRKTAAAFISEDEILGLCILYSYDFMHITHQCVSSYLETGEIPDKYFKLLKDKIE